MDYRQVVIHPQAHIAPNATIVGNVRIEREATILFNATLRGDYASRIVIGARSSVQENCCVHLGASNDCIVGEGVTVGHGAIIHGCTIGDNTLVGMGSIIMDGAVIGKNCIVGAGALVTGGTQIPDGMLVLGAPAKARRPLTDEEIAQNRVDADGYVAIGKDLVENGIAFDGAHLPNDIATIAVK
ncbi:gamma carbonic anhydrase family protein [Eggerthella sinensis]|jgi:carbonic anhydrase/acetyltransferase-like protein (isoleucine patch superfamily)|uniref:Gamma carbonic anhydrase family protein n=1 Tax=Eggerthella sinensis TaxID=242230 RepID=A0A3N0J104_9ACTN|nr:gamma carbonic anhydrase family protein [Eggerthella sinensis]RDB65112.1 gamma carbonic anhydrase family protein [Eggerthella sinensis]RNM42380.1 gamma carbonic anhydrase family protein [Eggerthella sinensis]